MLLGVLTRRAVGVEPRLAISDVPSLRPVWYFEVRSAKILALSGDYAARVPANIVTYSRK